jgi:diacylglycerol kinase
MNSVKSFSLKKRLLSFKYAFRGIYKVISSQHNAWIHSVISLLVIAAGFILEINLTQWCLIVFSIGFVFVAETINTAIENLVDMTSPDFHPKAGLIKDISAGAVLIAAITAVVIGLIIFIPAIIDLLK